MGMKATGSASPYEGDPIDWRATKEAIVAGLDIAAEYEALGVEFTRPAANGKGWRECRALGRDDDNPSAAVHVASGVYKDSGGGEAVGFLDFALKHGPWGSWYEVAKHYAKKAGVKLGRVERGSEGKIKEEEFQYHDEAGRVRYQVTRYRKPNGKKTFSQSSCDAGGNWKVGPGAMDGVEPLPYRLPEMLASPDAPVWVFEGEGKTDLARRLGLVGTTNHQGSGSTDDTWPRFLRFFEGRTCYVVPDNDDNGRKHARKVCGYLHGVAAVVKYVEIPDLPRKGDVADFLQTGGTLEELEALAEAAPVFEPTGETFETSERSETRTELGDDEDDDDPGAPLPWGPPRLSETIDALPFPVDVLPLVVAELCRAASAAVQCPLDYFSAASLAMAGGAIGMSVNFLVKPDYVEASNIYLALVGHPGSKKTPALKILARVLFEIDRDLREQYRREMKEFEARSREDGPKGDPPVQQQLTLDDTTREAVAQVHSENPRGLVLVKDELTSWVASLDAYRAGKGDDKQFWLKVYSGALVKVTRKGTREPIIIPQPCVTIVGGLTPDTLPSMKSGSDDGWIDRILFSYPEAMESRDFTEDAIPRDLLDDWHDAIRRLFNRPMYRGEDGRLRPYLVTMTDTARPLFRQWINAHRAETRHHDFPRSLLGPWSKLEGAFARLCLILSQLRDAFNPETFRDPAQVDALVVRDAGQIADYFKAHFRRARGEFTRRAVVPDDAEAILRWVRSTARREFSERDARQNFRGRFGRNLLALTEALDWLVKAHCLRPIKRAKSKGRPHSQTYEVNPHLTGGVSEPDED